MPGGQTDTGWAVETLTPEDEDIGCRPALSQEEYDGDGYGTVVTSEWQDSNNTIHNKRFITSDARIVPAAVKTIKSDARILQTYTSNVNSDASVLVTITDFIVSSASVLESVEETILSDAEVQ